MKSLFLVLSFVILLFAACSAETIVGPEGAPGHVVEPAEECGLDAKLC